MDLLSNQVKLNRLLLLNPAVEGVEPIWGLRSERRTISSIFIEHRRKQRPRS